MHRKVTLPEGGLPIYAGDFMRTLGVYRFPNREAKPRREARLVLAGRCTQREVAISERDVPLFSVEDPKGKGLSDLLGAKYSCCQPPIRRSIPRLWGKRGW